MRSYYFLCSMPAIALLLFGCCLASAKDAAAIDKAALENAFTALKSLEPGQDLKVLKPLDDAVIAAHEDAAVRKDLETQLAAILKTDAPRTAKDYVCRKLMVVGTAESVPALAALLADKDNSHMARYALERIPASEAAKALQDALPKVSGVLKVGVIGSLGARRDAASVPALAALPEGVKQAVADGSLACAERLLADGKKAEAMQVYKAFTGENQPKHVRLAATRGLLSVAEKKN